MTPSPRKGWVAPLIGVVVLSAGCGGGAGSTGDVDTVPVADLKVGDCLVEPPDHDGATTIEPISCDEPHRAEIVGEYRLDDGDFPSDAVVEQHRASCESMLDSELSDTSGIAGLDMLAPTEETWRNGDRKVACVAVVDTPRTGPLEGLRSTATAFFRVGDCLGAIPAVGQDTQVVDCAEPHAAEVFAVFEMPDGEFPGAAKIEEFKNNNARCGPELAAIAPAAMDDPSVRVMKGFPDERSWGMGHRSVTCFAAFDPPRSGSLKG